MYRSLLKSKIHRATVTQADLHYVGSITVDQDLLEAADILPGELVSVVDVTNGARLETYTIPGQRGSGVLGINGAAAHLIHQGDIVILLSYASMRTEMARDFIPTVVHVNAENNIIELGSDPADGGALGLMPPSFASEEKAVSHPPQDSPPVSGPQAPSCGLSASRPPSRVRIHHLTRKKERGEHFAMLTAYDRYTARIFDEASIEVLLVGDSAANNVFGHRTSIPVTVDELLPLCRAVAQSASHALVVADLPFGSYEVSHSQGVETGVRFLKEGQAQAVKIEGGTYYADTVRAMTQAGIPVMAHIGFTPQSEHVRGGYRVQGRGDDAMRLVEEAKALEAAGAFCILMEMIPAATAAAIDAAVAIPTIGIGAGSATTGQVLVWQDMAGLRGGEGTRIPKFVKQYADLRETMLAAARRYGDDVRSGAFPGPEHSFF